MAFEAVEVLLRVTMAGLAGILAFLTLLAYRRVRSKKLLFVGLGFAAFFVQGLVIVAGIFDAGAFALIPTSLPELAFDIAALALLYAGSVSP